MSNTGEPWLKLWEFSSCDRNLTRNLQEASFCFRLCVLYMCCCCFVCLPRSLATNTSQENQYCATCWVSVITLIEQAGRRVLFHGAVLFISFCFITCFPAVWRLLKFTSSILKISLSQPCLCTALSDTYVYTTSTPDSESGSSQNTSVNTFQTLN
jgi:hypothetical protein